MTQAPPTWPEIEALPEFQTAPPEKKMEGLRKWKQDVLDYSGVQYDEELDNIVASKLFEFDEKPMFKSWESPFKIIGYKGASGIMGVPESFESIKFQLASQLPDQVVAGMYALEPVVQPEIGHPFSKLSETFGRAKKIFDEGSTEVAKTYGQDIRKRLTEFRDAKQNASSLAEPEGSGLAPELLGMVAESVPPLLYQLPAGASATMLGGPQAGLGVMAGLSGVQSEAMAYEEARQGYLDQGLSVEEAEKAAFAPAIASGAITAGLTYIFPAGKEAITKLGKPAKDAVVKLAKDGVLKAFGKGFADEAPEEFFDQLAQGFVAKASYDKDRSFTQIWNDAWKAGVAGGLVGGPLQAGVNAISPNELPPVTDNPVIEQINQSLQQANDQFVNQIVDEAIGDVSDEQLQTLLVDTAQTRPEAARAIQEELDRRNVQTTVELPPEQATEDLNTIPTVEGDLVADFNLQMEQPVEGGEVMAVEDLAEIILEEEPTNEQDLPTQGQVQGQPEPTGEALTTEQAEVTEAPVEGAISQDELAQGVQDLMPLLVNRAKQAGVQDPEAVAQDAVIKAIGTAKTVEEARKFVNSKAIERAINDDLRKQYAESRTVKTTIEGGKKRTQLPTKEGLDQPVGNEGSLTLQEVVPSDQPTPEQNVQEAERRQVFDSNEDEFYSTLSPEDQAIWQRLNMPGKGRAPSDAQMQRLASKMRRFLVSKGYRDLVMTETKTKSPPDWTPSTTEQVVKLTQDYALDKGLGPVLDSIARRSQTPYKRYLARILKRQTGREIGIKAKVYNKWRPYDGLFGYDKGKPSIIVNLSNIKDPDTLENVVLHEVLHGQTLDLIDIYRESPDLLTGSQRQTLDKLNGLLETVRKEIIGDDKKVKSFLKDSLSDPAYFSKNPLARNLYGLTNLEEFVSEAMSNAEFNDLLKNIQVPGEEVSVWSKVVEFIKELLRITTPNTAAEAAFENILALVDEGKRFAQAEGSNPVLAERTLKPAMSPAASPAQQRVSSESATSTGMSLPPKLKDAVEWSKEQLRARGKFNDPIFQEMLKKDQTAASIMNRVDQDVKDLKALISGSPISTLRRIARGQKRIQVNPVEIDKALKGDKVAFSALPETAQEVVNSMRSNVDDLSQRLIDSGLLSDDLVSTVGKNLGVYLNRSYEIYDNPKYKEKMLTDKAFAQTLDDARAYLRKYILADYALGYAKDEAWANRAEYGIKSTEETDPTWQQFTQTQDYQNLVKDGAQKGIDENVASDNEIEKELYRLLDVGAGDGPGSFFSGVPGRKNTNILKRRKDIPVEIRNLWGEYKDPFVNYVRTVSKTASLLTNHRFLSNVATQGKEQGWLWEESDPNRPPQTVPVVSKNADNKALDPLAGLYGDEKLREAFSDFADRANNAWWVRAFSGLTGLSMASKTILSVQSTVRNFMGNILFAIGNGYLTPSNAGKLWTAGRAIESNLLGLTKDRKEWQAYVQQLVELGVIGESVSTNLLRELIARSSRDKQEMNMAEAMANDMLSNGRKGFMLAGKVYQSVDDYWKVYAFESEKARYAKAFPELSEAELNKKVVAIVRDVLPTYSLAPQIIQNLRKFPFIAPFVTFTSEVVRVAYNTIRIGAQEVQDPKTRGIGISRLVGAASAAILFPTLRMALKELLGFDDDDEEALRELLPDWQKNSQILLTGKDGNGKISYMDVSYLDPYGYLKQPFTAIARAQTPKEIMANTLQAVFSPIFSEQILAGAIADVSRNTTDSGRQVYSPQDSELNKTKKIVAHIWEAFEPGAITSMERIKKAATGYVEPSGRSYKLGNEVASVTLGNRISETDANQGLQQAARRFKRESREASVIFTSRFKNRGTVTPEEIETAYKEANQARYEVFRSLRRAYDASLSLGVTPEVAKRSLLAEEIGQENLNSVLTGTLKPLEASEDSIVEARDVDSSRIQIYRSMKEQATSRSLLK